MKDIYKKLIEKFLEVNQQINLSAIRDADEMYNKHILDALELLKIFSFKEGQTVVDVWTWGWFPLLPLAIENPYTKFIGIDARRKKMDAVNSIIQFLELPNVQCRWSRAQDLREQFDVVTARAVSYVDKLFEACFHLCKRWGYFVFFKQYSEEEHQDILTHCRKLRLDLVTYHDYSLFEGDIVRRIYILQR